VAKLMTVMNNCISLCAVVERIGIVSSCHSDKLMMNVGADHVAEKVWGNIDMAVTCAIMAIALI